LSCEVPQTGYTAEHRGGKVYTEGGTTEKSVSGGKKHVKHVSGKEIACTYTLTPSGEKYLTLSFTAIGFIIPVTIYAFRTSLVANS